MVVSPRSVQRRPGAARLRWRALLAAVLVSVCVGAGAADDSAAKEAQLKQLRARITELRQHLQTVRERQGDARSGLRQVEQRVGDVSRALHRLQGQIDNQRQRLAALNTKRDHLRATLATQRNLLARQLRSSYMLGRQEQLKILLNQGDPATVQRALVYYDYFNRARTRRIHHALDQLDALRQVQADIEHEQQRLQDLYAEQDKERANLKTERVAREKVLAGLDRELRDKGGRLKSMLRSEQELQQVLQSLQQALSDIPPNQHDTRPFSTLKGKLPWPVGGRIEVAYGSRRSVGNLRWRGVVIAAPRGTEVRAISHGRVAFADWLRGYGLLIIIDHGHGFMTLYGHNQSLYKEVGEWVEAGEPIASVGDSGGQNQSGLYFELRRQGHPLNPRTWCRGKPHRLAGINP